MNENDGSMRDHARPAGEPEDTGAAPSRVVAGILGVLAILPTLMLGALMPTMIRATRDGAMTPLQLGATAFALVLLPAAVALMFWHRRGAFATFVLAAVVGLSSFGSPFWRIVLGGVMVSVIGAVVAWLGGRRAASRSSA